MGQGCAGARGVPPDLQEMPVHMGHGKPSITQVGASWWKKSTFTWGSDVDDRLGFKSPLLFIISSAADATAKGNLQPRPKLTSAFQELAFFPVSVFMPPFFGTKLAGTRAGDSTLRLGEGGSAKSAK